MDHGQAALSSSMRPESSRRPWANREEHPVPPSSGKQGQVPVLAGPVPASPCSGRGRPLTGAGPFRGAEGRWSFYSSNLYFQHSPPLPHGFYVEKKQQTVRELERSSLGSFIYLKQVKGTGTQVPSSVSPLLMGYLVNYVSISSFAAGHISGSSSCCPCKVCHTSAFSKNGTEQCGQKRTT